MGKKGKKPASWFYWRDAFADISHLSIEARGGWFTLLNKMHWSVPRGTIILTPESLRREFGVETIEIAWNILREIINTNVFDLGEEIAQKKREKTNPIHLPEYTYVDKNVTNRYQKIIICNRRMVRERMEATRCKEKQKRYRLKKTSSMLPQSSTPFFNLKELKEKESNKEKEKNGDEKPQQMSLENAPPEPPKKTKTKKEVAEERSKAEEPRFKEFWQAYPNKKGKDEAWNRWCRMKLSDDEVSAIMAALPEHKKQNYWTKDDGDFVPRASTWLNNRRWKDVLKVDVAKKDPFPTELVI